MAALLCTSGRAVAVLSKHVAANESRNLDVRSRAQQQNVARRSVQTRAAKKSLDATVKPPLPVQPATSTSLVERVDNDPQADREYRPPMPGDEPDFFEGPQWNAVGLVVQYLWAIGIAIAIIACIYAVRTYNDGASDFKQSDVYQSAIELSVEPSTSDVDIADDAPPL